MRLKRHHHTTTPKDTRLPRGKRAQQEVCRPASPAPSKAPVAKQEGRPIRTTSGVKTGTKPVSASEMAKRLNGGNKNGSNKR